MKLRSEAKKLVAQSSEETFKASQTSIVYDTNGKQLLKFKGEKECILSEVQGASGLCHSCSNFCEDKEISINTAVWITKESQELQ